ncbi:MULTISPECIES: YerC/YecD family TrpR-related protein [Clostridium]|uniref:TrpR-like protein YerC/YecD n=1 Tax=Clostridium cibarium TaxID=2762247 RepID=A0ABR8PV39_9CLOT|nr:MULTISPECIES: YerC/YecD family TrpR-related protein [Clostridium]MBD7911994.1 TrpR-like protein YerC/YecD [Clostridium cibarium]
MSTYESKIKSDEMDLLFNAILKLKNIEECYKFFEDVATINEVKALAQRIQVAELLSEKKTYTEIAEITGASTATISRVNRCLNYGSDGYNMVLERIKER